MTRAFCLHSFWACLISLVIQGCTNYDRPTANLIESKPPRNPPAGYLYHVDLSPPLELTFDESPRSVTVNGTPADVQGNVAFWESKGRLSRGEQDIVIEWINPDGSPGQGAIIRLRVTDAPPIPPLILESSVPNGATDVDPGPLNLNGITIRFNEAIRSGTIEITPDGGKPLNWIEKWERDSVTITPPPGGKLVNATVYVLKIISVKDLAGAESSFEIRFSTKQ